MKLNRISFRKYVGFRIRGTTPLPIPGGKQVEGYPSPLPDIKTKHLDRVIALTSIVESGGLFGSVMNYDGTAMTAGLHQAIMVYPRDMKNQGPLGRLLRRIEMVPGPFIWRDKLWKLFENEGWYLAHDGKIRFLEKYSKYEAGQEVPPSILRNNITGLNGIVPKSGSQRKKATAWMEAFHEVFSHRSTFRAQVEYAKEHVVKSADRWKMKVPPVMSVQEIFYAYSHVSSAKIEENISLEMDLAAAFFWSNSVNAPSKAKRILQEVVRSVGLTNVTGFPKYLISHLGNTDFGRWDDDIPQGRYQRTRKAAMKLDLWPSKLFEGPDAIMPEDLPG